LAKRSHKKFVGEMKRGENREESKGKTKKKQKKGAGGESIIPRTRGGGSAVAGPPLWF